MSPVVPRFELAEESRRDGTHVICVRGEIHVSTAPELAQRLTSVVDSGKTAIVLDMAGVEFIDSTGLSVLLNGLRLVNQVHGRMAIVCTNPTVLRLFEITTLNETFAIFADRAKAVAHVLQDSDPARPSAAADAP